MAGEKTIHHERHVALVLEPRCSALVMIAQAAAAMEHHHSRERPIALGTKEATGQHVAPESGSTRESDGLGTSDHAEGEADENADDAAWQGVPILASQRSP